MSEGPLANQSVIDKAKDKKKRERLTREVVLKGLMSDHDGRKFIWLTLEEARCFENTFALDPCVHAFQSGERNYGLKLLSEVMNLCPDDFVQMLKESKETSDE